MQILAGLKDKVLDASHFDILRHAYELQNQNIEQLKTNNDALSSTFAVFIRSRGLTQMVQQREA